MRGAQPKFVDVLAMSLGRTQVQAVGVQLLVDPLTASTQTVVSDANGECAHALPLANAPCARRLAAVRAGGLA